MVKSNIDNLNIIIEKNNDMLNTEKFLLNVIDGNMPYNESEIFSRVLKIVSPTFFGRTSAYKKSVSSGRFNLSKNNIIIEKVSLLYEHHFTRLTLIEDLFDNRMQDFEYDFSLPFFKPNYAKTNLDSLGLKKYFFSDKFQNGLLYFFDFRKNNYMNRPSDTKNNY